MAAAFLMAQARSLGAGERLRIGLFGPYSSRNFGDTAIQMAVIANLRERHAGVEFIGISTDPADVVRTYGFAATDMSGLLPHVLTAADMNDAARRVGEETAVPKKTGWIRRHMPGAVVDVAQRLIGLRNILRVVGEIDMLLISGGGQLDDFWGGPWRRPYELWIWSVLCRLRGRKVVVFATGVDNLTTRWGKMLAFSAMKLAHHRWYRDQVTLEMLQEAGVRQPSQVCPDPAFSLSPDPAWQAARQPNQRPVALVCPIAQNAWKHGVDDHYRRYVDVLQETCERLIRAGAIVQLSNSQASMDAPLVEALAARIQDSVGADAAHLQVRPASTVGEYCALASRADVVIASRLHGVILPIVTGTPVIGISYMRKVSQLMLEIGMKEQCLELPQVSADSLTDLALNALSNASARREHIRLLNRRLRASLGEQYDAVLRVAGVSRSAQ